MPEVYIRLYHPDIKVLSDRTFRYFLRDISKIIREAHVNEVITLINTSDLNLKEKQSLRDRLRHQLEEDPCYYVEGFKKGSIELVIAASAVSIWLLQQTIGESVKEAYTQSLLHKRIVKFLKSGERDNALSKRIAENFQQKGRLATFSIVAVKVEAQTKKEIVITVDMQTPPEMLEQMHLPQETVNSRFVEKHGEEIIKKLAQSGAIKRVK